MTFTLKFCVPLQNPKLVVEDCVKDHLEEELEEVNDDDDAAKTSVDDEKAT